MGKVAPRAIQTISDLKPDDRNANKGTARGQAALEQSLKSYGAGRSILADRQGRVIAGNKAVQQAAKLGLAVRVVETDGKELVVVQRTDLDLKRDKAAHELAVADNRVQELDLDWDAEALKSLLDEGVDLGVFFEKDELADLLGDVTSDGDGADGPDGAPVDRAAEYREKWQTQRGQLWAIGPHRLLCGDSASTEDVKRLMNGQKATLLATDPPYNVSVAYGDSVNDTRTAEEYEAFTRAWFALWRETSERQVITPGFRNLATWCRLFGDVAHVGAWIKLNALTNGCVSRFSCWEPLLFYGRGWKRERPSDVFQYTVNEQRLAPGGESLTDVHPCPKSLAMWKDLIESYTEEGDVVAEAFSGSGTTFVAAHETGRVCHGMEIEPKYAAVVLERLSLLGLTPTLEGQP